MKIFKGFLPSFIIAMSLALAGVADAQAARMGGGKSFGSKPSYSQPYRNPNGMNQASPAQQPAYQSPAAQRNQAARESLSRRGGLMGMLGGLALGGLLGAMLFGGGFEHINFLDILIFGAIAFMLFKLFASRRQSGAGQAASGQGYRPAAAEGADYDRVYERHADPVQQPSTQPAGFDTDVLFKKGGRSVGNSAFSTPASLSVPADFDTNAFLTGAKSAYAHLQAAWDNGELSELRGLTTDKVFAELQDQLRGREGENRTELLKIDARLLEVREVGSDREASVLFDVLMRESGEEQPTQVQEIWHFVRSKLSKQPTWFLDGIQQTEQ